MADELRPPLTVEEWIKDRHANCLRIAKTKPEGYDKAGWLEDAEYFQAVLDRLATRVGELERGKILSAEQMLEKLCERASPAVADAMRLRFSMDKVIASHLAKSELGYERITAYRPPPPPPETNDERN